MSSQAGLPPKASDGVMVVSTSILIDAPIDKVWSVLTDFPSYREWNPFVREQKIVTKSKEPVADQTPTEGAYLRMTRVHIPPTFEDSSVWFPSSAFVIISHVDNENHRLAWMGSMAPRFILHTDRWQELSVVEGGQTKYETIEVFSGILAWVMKFLLGKGLNEGFKAMAEGLKKRSEDTQ